MPQASRPAPPDCGGRFAIQSFLGAGGMGSVYGAYDRQRQSRVAIKVMRQVSGRWIHRDECPLTGEGTIVLGSQVAGARLPSLAYRLRWKDGAG